VTVGSKRCPVAPAGPLLIAALVVGAAIGGWLAGSSSRTSSAMNVIGEVSGRISVANEGGTKVCVTPRDGGADRCAGVYLGPNDQPLRVGDVVSLIVGELRTGPAETIEILILERPASS
jgi:hypothetical protein